MERFSLSRTIWSPNPLEMSIKSTSVWFIRVLLYVIWNKCRICPVKPAWPWKDSEFHYTKHTNLVNINVANLAGIALYKEKVCGRMSLDTDSGWKFQPTGENQNKTGGYCINEREVCCICWNVYPWKQYRNPFIWCKCRRGDTYRAKSHSCK